MFYTYWSSFYYTAQNSGLEKMHKGVLEKIDTWGSFWFLKSRKFRICSSARAQHAPFQALWNWKFKLILRVASPMQPHRLLTGQYGSQWTVTVKLHEVVQFILNAISEEQQKLVDCVGFISALTRIAKSQGGNSSCPSFLGVCKHVPTSKLDV